MENLETELKIYAKKLIVKDQELIEKTLPNQLYAAIAVIIFTVLLFIIVRLFKRESSNTGLSGSGKTVLFYQLRDGSSHQGTVTSVEPNEGIFVLHSEAIKKLKIKPIHVVDVPGHSRLRTKLDDYVPKAAGIVFDVDAVEFLSNCRAPLSNSD
ncbi:OLC1v1036562C1 [Oldenlandia corymbosa var. corymbosa]|uniref:Signal recognition particle receptor subunit beta n=1 Tax=Oldenlandia corymbosa var. corymbosa TaxID=529605 RepID=A0AAV1CZ77_OLDCO|nr:OLC1v1036562C1 [Oldenlandia corymbosa var. corymbosa]